MKNIIFKLLLICCIPISTVAQTLILSDKSDGVEYLSRDNMDFYFDKVQSLELAIQLKDTAVHSWPREKAVARYRASYAREVLDISTEEAQKLRSMFAELFDRCNQLNKNLLPDTIRLIMVEGNHYGASTFFTRGHAIVFSKSSLANMPIKNFKHVMYHELFHIISRYHPALKDKLYNLIGFKYMSEPIWISNAFYKRILLNPDGVAMDYGIDLLMEDSTKVTFIPVISANEDQFLLSKPTFFSYLDFKLYPIDKFSAGYFMRSPEATSKLNEQHIMQQYFARITMNTQYIIHPDEILADNFLYLFRTSDENKNLNQKLLEDIKNILVNFEK